MYRIKLDKNGVLCLPRQAMELLNIRAGDRLTILPIGNELHIRKCTLALCGENTLIIGDCRAQLPRPV